MSEMVERVAQAIFNAGQYDDDENDYWMEECQRQARAAIAAMREPTSAMLIAAEFDGTSDLEKWQAMIDEAL